MKASAQRSVKVISESDTERSLGLATSHRSLAAAFCFSRDILKIP